MRPEFLLDTHIVVRWLIDPGKLSHEQSRVIRAEANRQRPLALSAATLLEIAVLTADGRIRARGNPNELLNRIEASPTLLVLPMTFEIATEVASFGRTLRDPADRAIVATARVHRLRLLTSDQGIIDSKLVPVVD